MASGRSLIMGLLALSVLLAATAAGVIDRPQAARADDEEIQVHSESAVGVFPENITFTIEASGPDAIEEVRVFLKPLGGAERIYGYVEIQPGTEVTGEYILTTGTGSGYLPPGTVINYYYQIRDSAGRQTRTEDRNFSYMDNREDRVWSELTEGIVTVHYYPDYIEFRAQDVLDTITKTMDNMQLLLGIEPTEPIRVVAYPNYADMSGALPFRSQAVREELQTQGQAYAEERVLLVLVSGETFTGIVSHEFTHILVAEAGGAGYSLVPAWLNEGLAEYGNIDQTEDYDRALYYAIFTRRLKPLWYQDTLGGTPDDIIIGYGQGKSVVEFLVLNHGKDKMAELFRVIRRGVTVDRALEEVYGFDQYGLDSSWRVSLGLEPLPSPQELAARQTPSPTNAPQAEAELSPTPAVEATLPAPEAESSPTPAVETTPTAPEAEAEDPAISDDGGTATGPSRSCGGPVGPGAALPVDLAMVALLAGTVLGLGLRRRLPRWLP